MAENEHPTNMYSYKCEWKDLLFLLIARSSRITACVVLARVVHYNLIQTAPDAPDH